MSTQADNTADQYPSIAWAIIPLLLLPLGYFVRARLAARKLARTGIGRGAPGFQTNVRRIAVTPEIAARLRRGEQVSPEEIAAAEADAKAKTARAASPARPGENSHVETSTAEKETDDEWLPDELKKGINKSGARPRKGKKRR